MAERSAPKLKLIGYWANPEEEIWYPDPHDFVDPQWETENRAGIVHYLRSGVIYRGFWGYSFCRFSDGPPEREMGSKEFTDGVYVWPEGLAVYVEKYDVILPEEFVQRMKAHGFQIPPTQEWFPGGRDTTFWIDWAKSHLTNRASEADRA